MQWTSSQQIVRLILDLTVFKSRFDDWSEKTLLQVASPQAIAGRNNKNEYLVDFRISPFSYFVNNPSSQFAKSQEFSNVGALHIFEHKVLLSVLNSGTIFERNLLSPDSVTKSATQNLGFSETGLYQSALKHGRRTFLYSAMGELVVCSGQFWARAALKQLPSQKVG